MNLLKIVFSTRWFWILSFLISFVSIINWFWLVATLEHMKWHGATEAEALSFNEIFSLIYPILGK
jgi:hypothetical protein